MQNRRKLILALTVVFTLNIMIIALAQRADAVTYARGSSGGTVRQIQQLLLDWGYYSGEVDGIFGSETEDAVEYFQSKNGLTVDGKVGPATMEALGIAEGGARPLVRRTTSSHCWRGSSPLRRGANPMPVRWPSAPLCSTVWSTHPSRTPSPRSSSSRGPSAACWTASGTSPSRTAPTRPRATPSPGPTPRAAPSTTSTPSPPRTPGSGPGRR